MPGFWNVIGAVRGSGSSRPPSQASRINLEDEYYGAEAGRSRTYSALFPPRPTAYHDSQLPTALRRSYLEEPPRGFLEALATRSLDVNFTGPATPIIVSPSPRRVHSSAYWAASPALDVSTSPSASLPVVL